MVILGLGLVLLILVAAPREIREVAGKIVHHLDVALGWSRGRDVATWDGFFIILWVPKVGKDGSV